MSAQCLTSPIKFQLRRDTSTNWSSINPVLYAGEPGVETNTGQIKVGDGIHTWNQLPYVGSGGTTGPTGASGSGTTIASSYGYSQTMMISNTNATIFKYDSTYIEHGTYLAANTSGDLTRVVVTQPGIYEIITSIQLQSQGATTNVFTWLQLNGNVVPDTSGGLTAISNIDSSSVVSLVSVPYMISMNAGDYIEIIAKTGSANVEAVAYAAGSSATPVAAPSIAINIKKIATDIGTTGPTGPISSVTGPTGVVGPTGAYAPIPVSMLGYFTNDPQSLPAGTDTLVRFNQLDTRNSVGTTGMTLAAIGNYVFTNTTTNSIPLLIDWYLAFNGYTGATVVYTYAGIYINGATPPTYRQGEMYSQFSIGSAAFVASTAIINVAAGESIGIYANSSSTANIVSGQSYVTLVPLTGFNGATGPQGVTGAIGSQGVRGPVGFTGPQGIVGYQGVQGVTGFQGVQGVQGVTGFQGVQGVQGVTGFQGVQGVQGVTGVQGVQGVTGFQGVQGVQGVTGVQGVQGVTGFQGVQGVQGVTGFQGVQGVTGFQGVQGVQGVTGFQGVQGVTGFQGVQGVQGVTGFQGVQGVQGVTGFQGVQGVTGFQGVQGVQGVTGFQGVQGVTGFQGVQGVTGFQGVQGVQGVTGFQGVQGVTGFQGVQGVTGFQGVQGVQGVTGFQGVQGVQGVTGFQGVQGVTGFQGVQGVQGVTGFQGVQGVQGVTGFQGVQGVTGFQGVQGVQGVTGFQGVQGVTGFQGVQGVQGVTGFQGVQGVTGFQGVQGVQGVTGFQGVQGVTGVQGVQGVTGFQGVQGVTGPTGVLGPTGIASLVPTGSYVLPTGYIGYMKTMNNFALPTTQLGNVARVDQVYGNDSTAYIGGLPFATVPAAINAIIGPTGGGYSVSGPQYTGTTIWVLPGTYNLSPTGTNATITDSRGATTYPLLTIPARTALRGLNIQTCTIQCSNPTQNTTLIKVGDNSRIEDLTLVLGGSSYSGTYNLVGLYYGGGTSVTSKLRTCVLTLCNTNISLPVSNNLYGVQFDGSGTLSAGTFSFNALKGSTINVYGNGYGNKRGIIVTNSNLSSTRDVNVYVSKPATYLTGSTGSYVGVETADSNNVGSIQLRSTTIGVEVPAGPTGYYSASDILQTNPTSITNPTYLASAGIQVGPGTDLVTKTAGGKGFSTYTYPTTIYYGAIGTLNTSANPGTTTPAYLWPGSVTIHGSGGQFIQYPDVTATPPYYRVQQPMILSGMSASLNVSPGVTGATGPAEHTTTLTVRKTPVGGSIADTAYSLVFCNGQYSKSKYDASVNFAAGDSLHLQISYDAAANTTQDVSVQLDCF